MLRILTLVAALLLAALGLDWLADRPGSVLITWQGRSYEMSLMTGLAIFAALIAAAMVAWALVRLLFRLPAVVTFAGRARRRAKGFGAVSRGLIAVGSGDARGAQKNAAEAKRLLGHEPMTLLLSAQAAQLAGDRPGAEAAFSKMLDLDDTRVLGLRGLFVEARRKGDLAAARFYAEEAHKLAPGVGWSTQAMLDYRVQDADWMGAIHAIEQSVSRRLVDKSTARRQRAVLLTAAAMSKQAESPSEALTLAQDALRLDPSLTPAAVLAGRSLAERSDFGKATRVLETAWKAAPHPDIADAYLDVRSGDSTLDRLARARTLLKLSSGHAEGRKAVARAALAARDWDAARDALAPLLNDTPTAETCLLMAQLEERSGGPAGRVREWLARASRAPRDAAWVADGVVQDHWSPASPITGRIDAFTWTTPAQALAGPSLDMPDADDVIADGDEAAEPTPERIGAPPALAVSAQLEGPVSPEVALAQQFSTVASNDPGPEPLSHPEEKPRVKAFG